MWLCINYSALSTEVGLYWETIKLVRFRNESGELYETSVPRKRPASEEAISRGLSNLNLSANYKPEEPEMVCDGETRGDDSRDNFSKG